MMILALAAKGRKTIAYTMLALLYFETIIPVSVSAAPIVHKARFKPLLALKPIVTIPDKVEGGPTQPEAQEFHSVGSDKMVDLFSGDFSYSIPLLDVGGYPLAIGYNSGITMDQEASWTGLGWNINAGAITRNMRGLPDDFNGLDSIKKTASVKENKTIGVSGGADIEVVGLPVNLSASVGVLHNTYRGWGLENSVGASISASAKTSGSLAGGLSLSLNNSSQDGLTISPSLSVSLSESEVKEKGGFSGSLSTSLSYNTRSGLKALQYSGGITTYVKDEKTVKDAKVAAGGKDLSPWVGQSGSGAAFSSYISFAYPSFTPSVSMPYTSKMVTVTAKVGHEEKVVHPSYFISGYISKQWIAEADKVLYMPAYGYLNYQNGARNPGALLDFNREKETVYREKPSLPNIAVPGYTYDVFSMSGEGTGGTFRAYRSDIGFVYDHYMKTRDASDNVSVDVGFGDIVHAGADYNYTRAYTQTGPWIEANPLASTIAFTKSDKNYEAVYFRNPGEKTINNGAFYDAIGGDDVVIPKLSQNGTNTPSISTSNYLTKYKNGKKLGDIKLTASNAVKQTRDKRTQLISYLTAEEASTVGFSTYLENYSENKYLVQNCANSFPIDLDTDSTGYRGDYYKGKNFEQFLFSIRDTGITFNTPQSFRDNQPAGTTPLGENFSVRWTGRLKAPVTGIYNVKTVSDDGIRLFINDSMFVDDWYTHGSKEINTPVNLEAGEIYVIKLEYFNGPKGGRVLMDCYGNGTRVIASDVFLPTVIDTFAAVPGALYKEKRVNSFRKANHISEIDVLNADGKKYIYGLPVYNLKQKETSFSVNHGNGNSQEGTTTYNAGSDNTTSNSQGNDHYFTSEEIPAFAHSFLLTGVVSADYTDLTGNGISDDDPGTAVKFNYTKIAGVKNPFKWRTPYTPGANYNEGLKTDTRDDKGSYVYGEKELWYLNSIESRNMIATFTLGKRYDQVVIDENGNKDTLRHVARKLEEINLYTKADFMKRNTAARPVKTVHFEYTYELCRGINAPKSDTGKLTLKRIWFTYNGNKKGRKNAYVFNYNAKNPRYDHKSFDRWGNFKAATDNPNQLLNAEYPYATQDSIKAASNAAAWTLDSIQLPSGGRIKITYEGDDYGYVQNRRAAQMFNIAGFSPVEPVSINGLQSQLYPPMTSFIDYLYVAVNVPVAVTSKEEVYSKYIEGLDNTIHFRLNVKMPTDKFGNGYEFVPCYAKLDKGAYGFIDNGNTIWFKVVGINTKAETGGSYSPMGKSAIQFLRLNLPSKAYPGSDVGDNLDFADGVKVMASMASNIKDAFKSYDVTARMHGWACDVDLTRSFVRLNNPVYKKYGGGSRVKSVVVYDNWNAMTGKKESKYGTEYEYKTIKKINGKDMEISSGVATYEPVLGGEENPLRVPVEYTEQISAMGPTNMGYTETPLAESFFPGASVGYSKVRSRSINIKNTRSANGFEETTYYTAYDFPTITENSLLDSDTKRRYRPALSNLLRIKAKHHLVMSQGFKVELNDMHGKIRGHYTYSETDKAPSSYTINYYHTDNQDAEIKHLNNNVLSMNAQGVIDNSAVIGKDVELMMDMREQKFSSNSVNSSANVDVFTFAIPPVLGIPVLLVIPQGEENLFRSVAATKVISRHGILDSVVVVDKGSKVVTQNMLYDAESGNVLLSATQNEFGDSLYQFNYPAGWVYDGMSGAYKNINSVLNNVTIKEGKIIGNISAATINSCFTSGDEILIYARSKVVDGLCLPELASFYKPGKIWAVDANALNGGDPDIYFMDQNGVPYTGNDVSMKVVRSGRRNTEASVGAVSMLKNPLKKVNNSYQLVISKDSKIINASVAEFKQNWQVEDRKKQKIICAY